MTTGEVADALRREFGTGSVQTVRRMIDRGDLSFVWSRDAVTEDVNGNPIHGHRWVTRESFDRLVARKRRSLGRARPG